ncbi:hypothetical protein ECDEC9E_3573 [Escherichia coli DEC9E]|nr:hypothetical protein ECDEC9E_3573 [Escherichia coli DEC9E]
MPGFHFSDKSVCISECKREISENNLSKFMLLNDDSFTAERNLYKSC